MDIINIEAKGDTPKVILDKGNNKFEIAGKSLPENVSNFYEPILSWLDEYANNPNESSEFVFKMEYFNTASSKMILQILERIKNIKDKGKAVKVLWYYPEDDEDMEEAGDDYSSLVDVPFELIALEEE